MSLIVLSGDILFSRGVEALASMNEQDNAQLCIIDIESFSSLREVKYRILNELTTDYRLLFIKGRDMLSKVLSPLVSIPRWASVTEYSRHISEGKGYTLEQALTVVTNYRELRTLTALEIRAVCALRGQNSIPAVSPFLHCSTKAAYQRVTTIARKMNLGYGTQFQYFLHREYTLEELQRIDYVQRIPVS
ncbi:hypothetical protein ACLEX4_08270 [Pseudescherichia vulneris]